MTTEKDIVESTVVGRLFGRTQIFTSERNITADNVLEVLSNALSVHRKNRNEIQYLYEYVRGKQPILNRIKEVRPEICNKIVINRANQIVTFKTANFIGEPLQYISRGTDASVPGKIEKLNSFMMSENKASKDIELAYWMFVCGVGYRLVLNDKSQRYAQEDDFDEAPFEVYTLDPRNTFVVKWNGFTKEPVMAVTYVHKDNHGLEYTIYTKDQVFVVGSPGSHSETGMSILSVQTHNFGRIPIIEYPCNALRMGAFEIVLGLLDAINLAESNRLDGVENFIQAIMVFENADIEPEQFAELRHLGAIKISSRDGITSKVYYLNEQLDQSQTQTLIDDLWQSVLEIVGMPSQGNANTSDSSNNGAVIMKNGWEDAEARAKETDSMWKMAETDFLKNVLKICREANAFDLKISDVEQKFSRRSYEDLLTKTQSFTTLIGADCPPIQAFTISGLVIDPESAAITYEKYAEEREKKMQERLLYEHNVNNIDSPQSDKEETPNNG